jgi:putative colanic acid biosynthesis acetyltransferase WcaF
MTSSPPAPKVDLSSFDNSDYRDKVPFVAAGLWFFFGLPILRSSLLPSSKIRVWILRLFGAEIGRGVVIRPGTRVKYPWLLRISDSAWLGEDCWIDNLCQVQIGESACISQGAYLCTGNHDWSAPDFALRTGRITLGDMAWVGAKAIVCPGAQLEDGAIATAGSVITTRLPAWTIWSGNPAVFIRNRIIKSQCVTGIQVGS